MKIKQKNTRLVRQNSNNSFFMPLVMVYIIILLTFLIWHVKEVLAYQTMVNNYQDSLIEEQAVLKIAEQIKSVSSIYQHTKCIPPLIPINIGGNTGLSIVTIGYCLMMPEKEYLIPSAKTIEPIVAGINIMPQVINDFTYIALEAAIVALLTLERTYSWIGIPFDIAATGPIDASEYAIVQTMPRYLIYDSIITIKHNVVIKIMIFYNVEHQEIDKVIYVN